MKITYLGHAAFTIETNGKTILIDPYNPENIGMKWKNVEADIVCITHPHEDHAFLEGVEGNPFVIDSPGEYEVADIRFAGVPAYHDDKDGAERGTITMYVIESEGIFVGHFGDIGHSLGEEQQERLGVVDVLMIPVGGVFTITDEQAASMVAEIEPAMVIPMHYGQPGTKTEEWGLAPLSDFLKEMGSDEVEPIKSLTIKNKTSLPEETEVVVLTPQFN